MKHAMLLASICAFASPSSAAITLHAGDEYTLFFSGLPESETGYFGFSPSGGVVIHLPDFEAGTDQLQFNMFEDSPDWLSVAGGVAEAVIDGTSLPDAFSDFNGGVALKLLAGSVTLDDVWFFFQEPLDGIDSRRYSRTIYPETIPGDFDADGDSDGNDFLEWQRGVGVTYDAGDLADWRSSWALLHPPASLGVAIPEPPAATLMALALAPAMTFRRRFTV